nr:f-box protein cpr30 [Quercus suber]
MVIWNPLIRKYMEIPKEPIEKRSGFEYSSSIAFEFGNDLHNHDYKVLRIVEFSNRGESCKERRIFSDSVCLNGAFHWLVTVVTATGVNTAGIVAFDLATENFSVGKKIEDQWPNKEWSIRSDSVFSNGALHWLVAVNGQSPENIVAFYLATEKFRVITTPLKAPTSCLTCLEVLEGQLCFIVIVDEMYNDIWLMKEYGDESSWTWIYKIEQGVVGSTFEYCKPLMCSKNNGKKIVMEECHMYRTYLIWYDIEKKTRKRVKIRKLPALFQTATCIGSLLLLDGDNVIDPTQKNNRNQRPLEGLNPLVKVVID